MQWLKAIVRFLFDYARWTPVILLYAVSCYITYFSIRYLDSLTTIWLLVHSTGYPIIAFYFLITESNFWAENKKRPLKEGLLGAKVSCYIGLLLACYLWPIFLVGHMAHMLYTTVVNTYRKLEIWAYSPQPSYYMYKLIIIRSGHLGETVWGTYNTKSEAKIVEEAFKEKWEGEIEVHMRIEKQRRNEEKEQ